MLVFPRWIFASYLPTTQVIQNDILFFYFLNKIVIGLKLKYNFCRQDDTSYVYNPINALHLLKRTSNLLPKLINKKSNLTFIYDFTELYEDNQRAYYGFADIHEYLQLDLEKLVDGTIIGKCNFLFRMISSIYTRLGGLWKKC